MFTIGPWSQEGRVFIYSDLLLWSLVRRAAPQSEQSGGEEKTFGTKTDSQVPQILEICLFHGGFTPEGNININTPITHSPVAVSLSRWAIGMFLGSLVSGGVSGGHLNPSVTVSLIVLEKVPSEGS